VNIRPPIISTAAVRADGTIIFGANDSLVHALNADGSPKWTFATQDLVETSPAIASDGSICVGSEDGKVYSLNGTIAPLSTLSSWPMFNRDAVHSGRADLAGSGAFLIQRVDHRAGRRGLESHRRVRRARERAEKFLIRAVGPTLGSSPLTCPIPSARSRRFPRDRNHRSRRERQLGREFFSNSEGHQRRHVFRWRREKDAAIALSLAPENYSAVVKAVDGGTGVALVEAYDTQAGSPRRAPGEHLQRARSPAAGRQRAHGGFRDRRGGHPARARARDRPGAHAVSRRHWRASRSR